MTEEQLNKGNELREEIRNLKTSISGFKKCIKNIDIGDGFDIKGKFVHISFERTDCLVRREKIIEFLWVEKESIENDLKEKEQELINL